MDLNFEASMTNLIIQDRLDNNRDAKVLITARNSETGTGKTTLALLLAKLWDRNGWTINKGFLQPDVYLAYYNYMSDAGDVLLYDDSQAGTDNRRSMSKENVRLSQFWTLNRTRNVVSILTMPTRSMLDKRLMELADVWINVRRRGIAVPYRIYIDDISLDMYKIRLRNPLLDFKEVITFKALNDDDYDDMEDKKLDYINEKFEDEYGEDMKEVLVSKLDFDKDDVPDLVKE